MTTAPPRSFDDGQELAMNPSIPRFTIPNAIATVLDAPATVLSAATPLAQSVATKETALMVQRALLRLPYYGVFDFLAFGVDRGTVTVTGYAYYGNLKSEVANAVKRVAGVDEG